MYSSVILAWKRLTGVHANSWKCLEFWSPAKSAGQRGDVRMFRVLLNVMYTMVETLRWPNDNDSDEWKKLRENFRNELSMSLSVCLCSVNSCPVFRAI